MATLWQMGEVLLEPYRVTDVRVSGHGEVYCLENAATQQKLAAKVYRAERGATGRGLEEFRRECRQWLNLPRHVNWVEAKRVELIRGHITLITEYVDGPSLRELLESDVLSLGRFLDVMLQVVNGLSALYCQSLFHGDLKPENILVDRFGTAKLIDLSLAYPVGSNSSSMGTAPYNIGFRSTHPDLFACGMILSEALFGLERMMDLVPSFLQKALGLDIGLAGVADHSLSDAASLPESAGHLLHSLNLDIMSQKLPRGEEAYALVGQRLREIYDDVHAEEVNKECWEEANLATRLASEGRIREAQALLEHLVRYRDPDANVLALLGSLCLKVGDIARAQEVSQAALGRDRRNSRAWLNLGGCHDHEQQREQEQAAYLKGLEMNPRRSDLWCNLARSYLVNGQGELGWRCMGRALMVDPDASLAVESLRMIEADPSPQSHAIAEFLNLHRTTEVLLADTGATSGDYATFNDQGVSLNAVGDYEAALVQFDHAIRLKPDCFQAWYNRGDALAGLGRNEEARQCLEKALGLNDELPAVWCAYADILRVMGLADLSRSVLEDALRRGKRSGKLLGVLGLACADLGDLHAASRWLEQATIAAPNDHEMWRNRGAVLTRIEDLEGAINCFTQALVSKSNDAEALYRRAECLLMLRRYSPARLDLEAVVQLEPKNVCALFNLGNAILLGAGDPAAALKFLDAALELRPGDITIIENRQTCLNAVRASKLKERRGG